MIAFALLLAAQGVPHKMLDDADNANAAYVQCLFAMSRAASGARLSIDEFERKLGAACHSEEEQAVRAAAAVMAVRGEPDAVSNARQTAEGSRRSVLETYRKFLELSR